MIGCSQRVYESAACKLHPVSVCRTYLIVELRLPLYDRVGGSRRRQQLGPAFDQAYRARRARYDGHEYGDSAWSIPTIERRSISPRDRIQSTIPPSGNGRYLARWPHQTVHNRPNYAARKSAPKLFSKEKPMCLEIIGPLPAHIVAFAQMYDGGFAITAASRLCVCLLSDQRRSLPTPKRWQTTCILIPAFLRNTICFSPLIAEANPLD